MVDIGQFIIRLHEWLVAPVCEVEGHIKKVDDLFVSFDDLYIYILVLLVNR